MTFSRVSHTSAANFSPCHFATGSLLYRQCSHSTGLKLHSLNNHRPPGHSVLFNVVIWIHITQRNSIFPVWQSVSFNLSSVSLSYFLFLISCHRRCKDTDVGRRNVAGTHKQRDKRITKRAVNNADGQCCELRWYAKPLNGTVLCLPRPSHPHIVTSFALRRRLRMIRGPTALSR